MQESHSAHASAVESPEPGAVLSLVGRQPVHLALALAFLHGLLIEELVLCRVQISVRGLDGAVTHTGYCSNLLRADRLAKEVRGHKNAGSRNR